MEDALDNSLEQLAAGTATAEECAAQYPQHADELVPLLRIATRLRQTGEATSPPPSFIPSGRARLLAHASAHPQPAASADAALSPEMPAWLPVLRDFLDSIRSRPAAAVLMAALVLILFFTSVAQAALPGDPLYVWKRTSERLWRAVHPDPLAADLALSDRRAGELIRVDGRERAEPIAREAYRESLQQLATYNEPQDAVRIETALADQRTQLSAAGVTVPELDELFPSALPPAQPTPQPSEERPQTMPATTTPTPVPIDPTSTEADSGPPATGDPTGPVQETLLPPVLETVSPDLETPDGQVTPTLPQLVPTVDTNASLPVTSSLP